MYKSCPRCGRIHPIGYKCNAGRLYNRKESTAAKIRATNRWKQKSKQIKDDAHFLCEYCLQEGIICSRNLEVHHIIPLEENSDLAYEDENLICLCSTCHKKAEAGLISNDVLCSIVNKRINS